MSNPNMTGVLTVEAQKDAKAWLDDNANAAQIQAVYNVLRKDFGNREKSMREQMNITKADIAGRPNTPASSSSDVSVVGTKDQYDALPKGARFRKAGDPEGQWRVKQ